MPEEPAAAGPLGLLALRGLAARLPSFAPLLSRLPARPASAALAIALNLLVEPGDEGLAPLRGATIEIRAEDAGLRFHLRLEERGFVAVPGARRADVTIRASAGDLLSLALREQDPDTLFFARRLLVEGDTERGLALKNRLDVLDPDAARCLLPPAALLRAAAVAAGLYSLLNPTGLPPIQRRRPPSRY